MNNSNQSNGAFKVLVFSKTAGFRHTSIPNGIAAIQQLGVENNFEVDATENAELFTKNNLAQYHAVIFLLTTGDVLNELQQAAFEQYIQSGGGYIGIHSASDTEYDWYWYGNLVGAYFQSHPAIQNATIVVADDNHPSTELLPERWFRTDEWYNFQINPRSDVHILATLDENTYSGGEDGYDHPVAWCHEYDGGLAWYTALGHTEASYTEPLFLQHILGGILYVAGIADGDCATMDAKFEKIILDDNTLDPMSLTVAPDGRVLYVQRPGQVKIYNPADLSITLAGTIPVNTFNEDGLLGIALDPDFEINNWVYLFYSPAGSEPKQHVSRFTLVGDQLDMNSEKVLLGIPVQRDQCCHSAGSLAFGPGGNLFISTGDNTNPFDSGGFAPIDERLGRSAWDAQKSASNTNDFRGKILRITPQLDGTYTIPAGNLFPPDGSAGKPEIYIMGCRNPFRISVDSTTGWLYWGEVGPDAGNDEPTRGPKGYDEWNQARGPGNYGWPYCIADKKPYIDYDFVPPGTSGLPFDCDNPVNNSPNNTGSVQLPESKTAWIWYPYDESPEFPELGTGGRTAMAGPVYHYDPNLNSEIKLPEYYDNTLFIYEWSRRWLKEVKLDSAGNILKINPFLNSLQFIRPMDMEMGPDGAIYMLEWGNGFAGGNGDSRLSCIKYFKDSIFVGVQDDPLNEILSSFYLTQNYPNPFNPRTKISYQIPSTAQVELSIYNLVGQKVAALISKQQPAGSYEVEWDATGNISGVYFYQLKTNTGFLQTKKLIFLK